jgi:hypothetical protein
VEENVVNLENVANVLEPVVGDKLKNYKVFLPVALQKTAQARSLWFLNH